MFNKLRHRRWTKKVNAKTEEQFHKEIIDAAKDVMVQALIKNRLNFSDPKAQVLMTGAMFTVLAEKMEINVDDLYTTMTQKAMESDKQKVGFQQDTRGYL